jgi:hypothetical protein
METVGRLAGILARDGVLLAANRFHGGWQKTLPREEMEKIFCHCGLSCLSVQEGVAGIRR